MKKYESFIIVFFLLSVATHANKDRPYFLHGRLNFNLLHLTPQQVQESRKWLFNSAGNGEPRLGVAGDIHLDTNREYRLTYDFELGYDPSFLKANGKRGRLRVRYLYSDLHTPYGKFTMGQHFNAIARESIKYDPLFTTPAGSPNVDQQRLYDGAYSPGLGGLGISLRARYFYLGYQTSKYKGLTYAFSIDQSQAFSDTNHNRSVKGATNFEHILKYNWAASDHQKLEVFIAQYLQEKTKRINSRIAHKFAVLYTYKKEALSAVLTHTLIEKLANIKNSDVDQLIVNYIHKEDRYALIAQLQQTSDSRYNALGSYSGKKAQRQYSASYRFLGWKGFKIDTLASYFDFKSSNSNAHIHHHALSISEVVRYDF